MAEPWEAFPDVEAPAGEVASWEDLPDVEPVPTSAQPVDAFKAKVGLSDPLAPAVRKYQAQQFEREELVRSGFKLLEEGDPELVDAKVANHFGISVDTVKAGRQDWLDGYAKATRDPRKWIEENPLAARLVFEHPERADVVVNDVEANLALKAFNKVLDWTYDFGIKPLSGNPEDLAAFEAEKQQQLAGRAERDAPKPQAQRDNAKAQALRENGSALDIAAQRAKEARAQLEISRMWSARLRAKALGQNTDQLDADIRDAEERSRALYLGEKGWTQVLAEGWATAQSTLAVVDAAVADAGTAGALGGTVAAVGTMAVTKNPAAATRAFVAGAGLGAKFGGAAGAASASFDLELGESYKGFLQLRTDAGKQLTEQEARGAALIAASLKTGIELAELSVIMKAVGPLGAGVEQGSLTAIREALATNPGFRVLAARAAKAWVGEGVEEATQGAANDAVGYLAKVKAAGGVAQKSPVFGTVDERSRDLVGGLLGGTVFGVGGLAVSTSTYAVAKSMDERAVATSKELANLASTPGLQQMPAEVAALVAAKTGEAGDEVTHAWIDASAFRRLFQTDKEAEAKAEELMGPEGKKALEQADFTGGRMAVPLETYLANFGQDDIAKRLVDDTSTRADRPTPREAKEQAAVDEAYAQKLAEELKSEDVATDETAPAQSPTVERFRELEGQLVESGRMTRDEARASLQPLKQGFLALAKRFGQKAEDLFEGVRFRVDDGTRQLLVEDRTASASRILSSELNAGALDPTRAAERLYVDDHVTGLFTIDGFNELLKEEPAASVATLTLTDIKPVNDSEKGGHDTANALLAHVAPAVAAVDPRAARKGTSFVIRGGAAELQRALEGVQALLPAGMQVRGATAPTVKEAQAAMDQAIDQERASGKGTLPAKREETFADLSKLPELEEQFAEAKKTRPSIRVQVTPRMVEGTAALSPEKYFERAYQDPNVPGVLNGIGWNAIPRKAFVGSIDIKGLKAVNQISEQVFGDKRLGDAMLKTFMQEAELFDGSDFDFAHLSGDEFAVQADSREELQAWLDTLTERLTAIAVPVDHPLAGKKRIPVEFRSGIGENTYGAADRALNAAKRREKAGSAGGVGAGEGPRADGRVHEGVSGLPVEAGRAGSGQALRRAEGGTRPAGRTRRGSARQAYRDQAGVSPPATLGGRDSGGGGPSGRAVAGDEGSQGRQEVDTSFDPPQLDAELAADAVAADQVERILAERTARGPERSEERLALEQGFNGPEQLAAFRAALGRLKVDTVARFAAGEAFAKWVENTGPRPELSAEELADTEATALEFNVVDPDKGLTAIVNRENSKPQIDKDMRRAKTPMARSGYERELQRDRREAFEKNVLGRVKVKQDDRGFMQAESEGTDRIFRIALLPKADRSTFLHESAHVFLELLANLAQRGDAPQSVRDDFATALKWFGESLDDWNRIAKSFEGMSLAEAERKELTPEQKRFVAAHEKWAEAFEVYLSKGEYPSARLAGPFQRFRLWLGQMAKRIAALTQPSPEIEAVFGRLLATDRELEATQRQMGLQALPRNLLGMTPEQYNEHLDKLAKASSHAQHAADLRIAKDRLRATERWWKDEHRAFAKQAAEEFERLPARKAQLLLEGKRTDELPGIDQALSREVVEGWLGKDVAARFRLAADGLHPDAVVEAFGGALGFTTGREMLEAVVALPDKEDFVAAQADQQMAEKHPGVLDERQRLRELVAGGLHGPATREWALAEWKALTARTAQPGRTMPTAAALQRAAQLVAAGRPAGHLGMYAALVAERKASAASLKAATADNFELAAVEKQKQLLNMYLYDALREASEKVRDIETLAGKLGTLAAKKRLGKGHPTYRDAVELLLSTFGFEEPRESLAGSLDVLLSGAERLMLENADTVGFDRARIVDRADALQGDWRKLPVEDLLHVERALRNIEAAARNRATVVAEQKRIDKETAVAELLGEGANLPLRPQEPTLEAETLGQAFARKWSVFDGGLLKVETMARWLSGAEDTAAFVKSAMFRYLVEPMQAAKVKERDLFEKHITPLVDAFNAIPEATRARMNELIDGRKYFPGHVAEKVPQRRFEVLMMLLHSGNESNLQRLTEGRNITEAELRAAALDLGVTKEEYAWLQQVWDSAESLKPLAFDLEESDSGVRPEAIVARAFSTPFGEVKGGYFPAVYDRITRAGLEQEASLAGLQDKSYTRPGTSHSFLKKRTDGFTDILSLSPGSIQRHFAQVVHDVAYRQAVKSVGTLIMDRRIQSMLRDRLGSGRAEQLLNWVRDVAQMRGAQTGDNVSGLRTLASAVRGNIVTAVLGWKLPNAIEDFSSNITSALAATDLQSRYLATGVAELAAAPKEGRALALEKSGELRTRQGQVQRELAKQIRSLTESGWQRAFNNSPLGWFKENAFAFAEAVEVSTSTPIWLGAYRQALAGKMSDADAVRFADATVRQALVSHNPVDMAAILRDKGVVGHMLMFHGAFNHFYNQLRGGGGAQTTALLVARRAGRTAGIAVGLFLVGSIARGQGPDKDEPVSEWVLRKMLLEGVMQLVPGLGEVGNGLSAAMRGRPSTVRNNSLMGVAASVTDAALYAADSDKEPAKRVAKVLSSVVGPVTGFPVAAPAQSLGPVLEWALDENEWRNPGDAASDVVYGRKKGEPFNIVQGAADLGAGARR